MSDDWRTFFDKEYAGAWDLPPEGATVVFERVKVGELVGQNNKKAKKLVAWFRGAKKPMAFNVTNCKTVAAMYGNRTADWIGKAITIYPTQTSFGGATVDCIRVKPSVPQAPARQQRGATRPVPELPEQTSYDAVPVEDEERDAIAND